MNGLRISKVIALLTMLAALILSLAVLASSAIAQDRVRQASSEIGKMQSASGAASSSRAETSTSPRCDTAGKNEITITCHYTASLAASPRSDREPRIVLNDAVLSFKTRNESHMHLELTFTNEGSNLTSDGPSVYLAIDDDSGRNYVRRRLPHTDFRNLAPGAPRTFSERLLIPALRPGHYAIRLWIPSPDPGMNSDSRHNLLLSSVGVPEKEAGFNLLATFSIAK
jgi:hypothetical protein